MSKIGTEVIYLLGFLTEAQWIDAYNTEHLKKATLDKYRKAVEDTYDIKLLRDKETGLPIFD